MKRVDLEEPLASYFAHAEGERRNDKRCFTITLPYRNDRGIDSIKWYWRLGESEERIIGEEGVNARRLRETARFCRHVERWLEMTRQQLRADGPIPRLISTKDDETSPATAEDAPAWSDRQVANT
ncbi:MAG: hypothetical protein R3E77_01280 [Steroidobacteraceae bacterium]